MFEPWMGCADSIPKAINALITLNRISLLTLSPPPSLETEVTTTSSASRIARNPSNWDRGIHPSASRYRDDLGSP